MSRRTDRQGTFRRDDYRQIYRHEHPLAIWFTAGIAFTGFLTLFFPDAVESSATYLALPEWLRYAFNICYFAGGTAACAGLVTARHPLEAAGMALLASALLTQYASIIYVRPPSIWAATFVLTLAIGCGRRAWVLAR